MKVVSSPARPSERQSASPSPSEKHGDSPPSELSTSSGNSSPVIFHQTEKPQRHHTLPLSMQLMRPFAGLCCPDCGGNNSWPRQFMMEEDDGNQSLKKKYDDLFDAAPTSAVSPMVVAPMMHSSANVAERLIAEYVAACHLYGCSDRINAGILTTLRFSLPCLRVTGNFHDADMLALVDVLLRHMNGSLSFLKRLDFSVASKEGKRNGKCGFRSHGALALAKVIQHSEHVEEIFLQRNGVGPFGASAIFIAASQNSTLRKLVMRRCRVMERGGLAFAELCALNPRCGLQEVDLSANHMGFRGSIAIEEQLSKRDDTMPILSVDIEGNLVFQEVMNGVTHGMGILLGIVGGILLSKRVENKSRTHVVSCAVYSTSLLVLYISSTLYHSFFTMQHTKYIFEVLDKCAIYILIAGSYTPFLQIVLRDNELWSSNLLFFIWGCCLCGIFVEAWYPTWKHKGIFSLAMYLGMGWSCVVCLPELVGMLPHGAMNMLVLGGVGYTSGVPFFVRNNNLDHSIWHCFVLAGSMFHWFGIYWYVATID